MFHLVYDPPQYSDWSRATAPSAATADTKLFDWSSTTALSAATAVAKLSDGSRANTKRILISYFNVDGTFCSRYKSILRRHP